MGMTPLAWLLGLLLPACGASGAAGLPSPRPMDVSHIERPSSPNTALAAPAEFVPKPDIVTPRYDVAAPRLYADILKVAGGQPRTFEAAAFPAQMQAHFVARSAWLNFPDLIVAQVTAEGPETSSLVLYSRSVYGYGDFGVNRARLVTWLAALDRTLNPAKER
jgi:uncharacterized protein (DUF1499 family)